MSQSDQTPSSPKYFRPYVSQEVYQIIVEQSAKSIRLYGASKNRQEWLEEAISEKKAREDQLEESPQARLLQVA